MGLLCSLERICLAIQDLRKLVIVLERKYPHAFRCSCEPEVLKLVLELPVSQHINTNEFNKEA